MPMPGPDSAALFAVRSIGVAEGLAAGASHLPQEPYFSIAPDWVCEVVSPSTAAIDRVKKITIYAREQVHHAWLIDSIARTLEVLRLERDRWTIVANWSGFGVLRAEPFEAIELDLSLLWEES